MWALSSLLLPVVITQGFSSASWDDVLAQASEFSPRYDLIRIQTSAIHGRGVVAAGAIAKGTKLTLQWFDYVAHDGASQEGDTLRDGLRHADGYIPSGNDIRRESMLVAAARVKCFADAACQGITFQHADPTPSVPVWIDFKTTTDVSGTAGGAGEEWHSWVRTDVEERRIVFFPLTCGSLIFPKLLPLDLPPAGLLACSARMVNHACDATIDIVAEPMPADFAIPGIPYTRGRDVKGWYAIARRDLSEGDEITVNYFTTPKGIAKPATFVKDEPACLAAYDRNLPIGINERGEVVEEL